MDNKKKNNESLVKKLNGHKIYNSSSNPNTIHKNISNNDVNGLNNDSNYDFRDDFEDNDLPNMDPYEPSASEVASNKIKNALKNKFSIKNNKNNTNDNNGESKDSESDKNDDNDSGDVDKSLPIKVPTAIKIKLALTGAIIFGVLFLIVGITMAISSLFGWIIGGNTSGINHEEGSRGEIELKAEQEYNKQLQKNKEYYNSSKKCSVSLDINYVDAVIMFKQYYSADITKGIDYNNASKQISEVTKVMGSECKVDYEINGNLYKNLKSSSFFNNYYADLLEVRTADSILNDIFMLADGNMIDGDQSTDELLNIDRKTGYICNTSNVYKIKYDNGNIVKEKNLGSLKDYLSGIVYYYMDNNLITTSNISKMEAMVIAATTKIMKEANFDDKDCSFGIYNTLPNLLSCSSVYGCSYTTSSRNDVMDGGNRKSFGGSLEENGFYYFKKYLTDNNHLLITAVNNVYGQVLTYKSGGLYDINDLYQIINYDGDYKTILSNVYTNSKIDSGKEDNYTFGVDFGDRLVKHNVVFYEQTDYKDKFCNISNESIATSGCGTTSMAMILSTFIDKKFDPVTVMKDAYNMRACGAGIDGTAQSYFKKKAINVGLKFTYVSRSGDLNIVTSKLSSGNSLVVVLVSKGKFSGGGHYMVISGIDPEARSVYIHDPYTYKNSLRGAGNGWYKFSELAKEARGYFIITKG